MGTSLIPEGCILNDKICHSCMDIGVLNELYLVSGSGEKKSKHHDIKGKVTALIISFKQFQMVKLKLFSTALIISSKESRSG